MQNTRSLFYGRHYSPLHRLMSLHRKLNVKIFLMFIVAENTGSVNIIQCCDISVTYVFRTETSSIELLQLYKKNIIRAINMLFSLYGITFWLTNYICVQVSGWFVNKDGRSCFRLTENFRHLCNYWTDFVELDTKQILNVFYIQVHM